MIPTTCDGAGGETTNLTSAGCCYGTTTLYYCKNTGVGVSSQKCTTGTVCGWNDSAGYYDCVSPPSTVDPSGTYPIDCH